MWKIIKQLGDFGNKIENSLLEILIEKIFDHLIQTEITGDQIYKFLVSFSMDSFGLFDFCENLGSYLAKIDEIVDNKEDETNLFESNIKLTRKTLKNIIWLYFKERVAFSFTLEPYKIYNWYPWNLSEEDDQNEQ